MVLLRYGVATTTHNGVNGSSPLFKTLALAGIWQKWSPLARRSPSFADITLIARRSRLYRRVRDIAGSYAGPLLNNYYVYTPHVIGVATERYCLFDDGIYAGDTDSWL